MTTLTEVKTSDLILRVSGGSRDGELIPVSTSKCYLGMESENDAISKNPQCVIFRGRQGAVIRSYADQVLFNDAAASLHWLRKGDSIKFPNSTKVEVVQLGELKDTVASSKPRTSDAAKLIIAEAGLEESRIAALDSELRSIQQQNEQSLTRFDQLDSRLDMLTEKMTMLINLSSNGSGVELVRSNEVIAPVAAVPAAQQPEQSVASDDDQVISPIQSESPVQSNTEQVTTPEQVNSEQVTTSEEVIQSPVTTSPEEELERIDKALADSASGYYSHADDSDEQILTFSSDSEPEPTSTQSESAISNVVDQPLAPSQPVSTAASTDSVSTTAETESQDQSAAQAEAAAEAKAIADALAEKESRISEMERIFGGALSEAEPSEEPKEETKEESSPELSSPVDSPESTETPAEPVTSVEPAAPTQPADEQLSQTFEDLAHGQNAEVDSSADNSQADIEDRLQRFMPSKSDEQSEAVSMETPEIVETPETVETSETADASETVDTTELEANLSPMARQLLADVKADQEQESASTPESSTTSDPSSVEAPLSTPEPTDIKMPVRVPESARVESETIIVPQRQENESVADLLARMQQDGSWQGIPDDDAPVEPVEPVQSTPDPEPEPMNESADSEDDVEDYMSQLLSRMRGEEPVVATKVKKDKKKKEKKEVEKPETPLFEAPTDPLKPEEFKPKQKATKLKSLDAMRELANSNARTNVKVSQFQHSKERVVVLGGIAVGALLLSLFYLLFWSTGIGDMNSIAGIVCLGVAGFCGYNCFQMMKQSRSLVSVTEPEKLEEPVDAA